MKLKELKKGDYFKLIAKKIQAHKDRKFLARLERVLKSNIVKSDILMSGSIFIQGDCWLRLSKSAAADIAKGTPLNLVQERVRQGYYEKQEYQQSDL